MPGLARPRGAWSVALALALTSCAARVEPNVVLPERRGRGTPTSRDLSGPRDRGDIEIALGVVTSAVATTLIVLGSVSAHQASTLKGICRTEVIHEIEDPRCVDPTGFDPIVAATVSSALSFTFALPIAVGGGFLLGKGVRMRRAWQREQAAAKLSFRPWADQRGAGLGLSLRF